MSTLLPLNTHWQAFPPQSFIKTRCFWDHLGLPVLAAFNRSVRWRNNKAGFKHGQPPPAITNSNNKKKGSSSYLDKLMPRLQTAKITRHKWPAKAEPCAREELLNGIYM